jgi:hypothetical protein
MKMIHLLLALLAGLGLGLAYSWTLSPVTYVDASPDILRVDFKDQYRSVIAASYASTHDLGRTRARLELLGDADPAGELSAQAQRMVAAGESAEAIQPIAQLAQDLQQGFASVPSTSTSTPIIPTSSKTTPPATITATLFVPTKTPLASATSTTLGATALSVTETPQPTSTNSFAQTAFAPAASSTFLPRPTFTPIPPPGKPFELISQDTVCEPAAQPGLMKFILTDKRRKQVSGIEIIVTWDQGEDHFFTGFKPELGNGYADFVMQADTIYSVRVVEGGASIPNISTPICKESGGVDYAGGWLLTFQQQ